MSRPKTAAMRRHARVATGFVWGLRRALPSATAMRHRARVAALLAALGAAALAAVIWGCGDPAAWWFPTVEETAAIVTIASLTISPVLYFAKRWHSDKTEGKRAATAIYMELADARDGLDPGRYRDLRVAELSDQTRAYFMSRLLNHDIYDSLVNSGKITFIAAGLQQDIQDVFQRVKDHNALLRKVRKMQEAGGGQPHAHHLYRSLGITDDALLGRLPETMRMIEAEYAMPGAAKQGRFRPAG